MHIDACKVKNEVFTRSLIQLLQNCLFSWCTAPLLAGVLQHSNTTAILENPLLFSQKWFEMVSGVIQHQIQPVAVIQCK